MALDQNRFNALFHLYIPSRDNATFYIDLVATCHVESEAHCNSLVREFQKQSSIILQQIEQHIATPMRNCADEQKARQILSKGMEQLQQFFAARHRNISVQIAEQLTQPDGLLTLNLPQSSGLVMLCGSLYPSEMIAFDHRRPQDLLLCAEPRGAEESTEAAVARIRAVIDGLQGTLRQLVEKILEMQNPRAMVREADLKDALSLKEGIESARAQLKSAEVFIFEPDFLRIMDLREKSEKAGTLSNRFTAIFHFDVKSTAGAPRTLDLLIGVPMNGDLTVEELASKFKGEWAYACGMGFEDYALTQLRTMALEGASRAISDNLPLLRKHLAAATGFKPEEISCQIMCPSKLFVVQTAEGAFVQSHVEPRYALDDRGRISGGGATVLFPLDLGAESSPPSYLSVDCTGFTEEEYKRTIDSAYLYLPLLTASILNGAAAMTDGFNVFAAADIVRSIMLKIAPFDRVFLKFADMSALSTVRTRDDDTPPFPYDDGAQRLTYAIKTLPYVLHLHIDMEDGARARITTDIFTIVTIETEEQREQMKQIAERRWRDLTGSANHMTIRCRSQGGKTPDLLYVDCECLSSMSRRIAGILNVDPDFVHTVVASPISNPGAAQYIMQEPDADPRFVPLYLKMKSPIRGEPDCHAVILIEREDRSDADVIGAIQAQDTSELARLASLVAYDADEDYGTGADSVIGEMYQALYLAADGHEAKFFPEDSSFHISACRGT